MKNTLPNFNPEDLYFAMHEHCSVLSDKGLLHTRISNHLYGVSELLSDNFANTFVDSRKLTTVAFQDNEIAESATIEETAKLLLSWAFMSGYYMHKLFELGFIPEGNTHCSIDYIGDYVAHRSHDLKSTLDPDMYASIIWYVENEPLEHMCQQVGIIGSIFFNPRYEFKNYVTDIMGLGALSSMAEFDFDQGFHLTELVTLIPGFFSVN